MRKSIFLLAALLFVSLMYVPAEGQAASQVDKINKELAQVRKQMQQAALSQKQAEHDSGVVQSLKAQTAQSLQDVINQIDTVGNQINMVQGQIDRTSAKLEDAARSLDEAEARIKSGDELLQSRIRLSYTNGVVSYLDVLMSASSFSDFLDRMDSLHSIMDQDKEILEQHKKDKELVIEKKKEVEASLAEVKTMYAKLNDYKTLLGSKESQKQVMILSYNAKLEELEEISEDQQQLVMDLAKKEAELIRKRQRVRTYYTGGKLAVPLKSDYRISSSFGYRIHPISHKRKLHAGVDFADPEGTPIYAAESGVVILAQWMTGYGNCVIIDHGNGLWTVYGHIRNGGIKVEKGENVKRGEKIAEVGSTGQSTGNHLHFEVRKNGEAVNPMPYLK
ncbi:murein hydrolase activator EnvC family protein [Paenibacillus beijingensis]|uniref:Membrane protein n=1 Tax=Paenibacillus beijingensis TaxID=1126833 RepID=A0A0D5NHT7_9BACL|nr:peptidoglycan DD-metalloendopeptidase family protein [Paenibacillus beijingensis]AJY74488.1 membrane protein [Paenibacillus beijingensis]